MSRNVNLICADRSLLRGASEIAPMLGLRLSASGVRVEARQGDELSLRRGEEGIVLTGGGALLEGMDECIQAGTHVRTRVAASPRECVARGAAMALEDRGLLEILEGK